ncbi:restriction endonuclease subunit S [[Clostridium] aminophilum]|uniref:restriction endonuclease subunit S n=1 Tax=[Clostridium] aminophilum TaxID=1526 RepID=UPI003318BBF5
MREMKDSGIEWIGEIPTSWETRKLFGLLQSIGSGTTPKGEDNYSKNGVPWLNTGDLNDGYISETGRCVTEVAISNYSALQMHKAGSIVIAMYGATIGKLGITEIDLTTNQACCVMNPTELLEKKFLFYILMAAKDYFLFSSYGAGQPNISQNTIRQLKVPYTDIINQRRICEYVDEKCTKIDAIIEKQQEIIEKLKEYKLSVITEAVTKGLNPNVEMKDSGSIWFGKIPETWSMKRLKFVFHIQKDIAGKEGHTVLSITQRGIVPKDFSNNEGQFAKSYANYQLVHKGDFAMNHMDLLTGWVDISNYEGVTSPDYRVFVLDDKDNCYPEYYLYMMQMCYNQKVFYGLGAGVSGFGRWRLQADKFLNFWIPIPPLEEQKAIAKYINTEIKKIDTFVKKREKIVEKLTLYKKSLIYEVVTGKREV